MVIQILRLCVQSRTNSVLKDEKKNYHSENGVAGVTCVLIRKCKLIVYIRGLFSQQSKRAVPFVGYLFMYSRISVVYDNNNFFKKVWPHFFLLSMIIRDLTVSHMWLIECEKGSLSKLIEPKIFPENS